MDIERHDYGAVGSEEAVDFAEGVAPRPHPGPLPLGRGEGVAGGGPFSARLARHGGSVARPERTAREKRRQGASKFLAMEISGLFTPWGVAGRVSPRAKTFAFHRKQRKTSDFRSFRSFRSFDANTFAAVLLLSFPCAIIAASAGRA